MDDRGGQLHPYKSTLILYSSLSKALYPPIQPHKKKDECKAVSLGFLFHRAEYNHENQVCRSENKMINQSAILYCSSVYLTYFIQACKLFSIQTAWGGGRILLKHKSLSRPQNKAQLTCVVCVYSMFPWH